MTSFVRTWNAAYEANPASSQDAREGAARITELKRDIRERAEVDHSWAGDANDGAHKKVTLLEGLAPTFAANTGFLYAKDVAGITELFYKDSSDNEIQLTNTGRMKSDFAAGVKMLFQQTTAPTGWTKDITHNDKALRIVNGAASSGGALAFSAAFAARGLSGTAMGHSLTEAEMPKHYHQMAGVGLTTFALPQNFTRSVCCYGGGTPDDAANIYGTWSTGGGATSGSESTGTGVGNAHSHTLAINNLDLAVQYVDVIIATKD